MAIPYNSAGAQVRIVSPLRCSFVHSDLSEAMSIEKRWQPRGKPIETATARRRSLLDSDLASNRKRG